MVTDCFGARAWDFSDTEAVFLQGSLSLLKIIVPCAICLALWRLHAASKDGSRRNASILGLNEVSTGHQEAAPRLFFIYVSIMIVTFNLGLLSVLACEFLRHTLHQLLS